MRNVILQSATDACGNSSRVIMTFQLTLKMRMLLSASPHTHHAGRMHVRERQEQSSVVEVEVGLDLEEKKKKKKKKKARATERGPTGLCNRSFVMSPLFAFLSSAAKPRDMFMSRHRTYLTSFLSFMRARCSLDTLDRPSGISVPKLLRKPKRR